MRRTLGGSGSTVLPTLPVGQDGTRLQWLGAIRGEDAECWQQFPEPPLPAAGTTPAQAPTQGSRTQFPGSQGPSAWTEQHCLRPTVLREEPLRAAPWGLALTWPEENARGSAKPGERPQLRLSLQNLPLHELFQTNQLARVNSPRPGYLSPQDASHQPAPTLQSRGVRTSHGARVSHGNETPISITLWCPQHKAAEREPSPAPQQPPGSCTLWMWKHRRTSHIPAYPFPAPPHSFRPHTLVHA